MTEPDFIDRHPVLALLLAPFVGFAAVSVCIAAGVLLLLVIAGMLGL